MYALLFITQSLSKVLGIFKVSKLGTQYLAPSTLNSQLVLFSHWYKIKANRKQQGYTVWHAHATNGNAAHNTRAFCAATAARNPLSSIARHGITSTGALSVG